MKIWMSKMVAVAGLATILSLPTMPAAIAQTTAPSEPQKPINAQSQPVPGSLAALKAAAAAKASQTDGAATAATGTPAGKPATLRAKPVQKAEQSATEAAVTTGSLAKPAAAGSAAKGRCTRLAFEVNDWGKEGPTNDAKALLDKHIANWAGEKGIKKYTVGKKTVNCRLFLDFGFADEHTCRAEAPVCW